jgi:protein-S-isoprenylcysteine O-methyltransferase Ste14
MARLKVAFLWLVPPTVFSGLFFLIAGHVDLPGVWGVLGVLAVFTLLTLRRIDPGLLRERYAPGPGNRDRLTRPLTLVFLVMHWVLTALDVGRYHWSPVPWEVQLIGLVGYAVALGGVYWAMRANPFYSCVVRIQTDRGQRPITAGPYRFVRHPGYTATMLGMLCGGLAFGSWVGLLPLVGVVGLFLRRTLVEDRMLRTELPGYADYAGRVRYRLVAGVF